MRDCCLPVVTELNRGDRDADKGVDLIKLIVLPEALGHQLLDPGHVLHLGLRVEGECAS